MTSPFADKDFSDAAPPTTPHWETRKGIFNLPSYFITIQEILFSPSRTFSTLFTGKSLFNSFLFGLLGTTIGLASGTFWQLLINQFSGLFNNFRPSSFFLDLGQLIGVIFVFPVFIAAGLFIGTGILHLCLTLTGAAKKDFSVTFKVVVYAQGATGLLGVIPIFGSVVGMVWGLYIEIIGLRLAHKTTTGRVLLAIFLPFLFFCFFVIGALFFVFNLGLLSSNSLW